MAKTKETLIKELEYYVPYDETESAHVDNLLAFLENTQNPFVRTNLAGHITGSAFLLNKDKTKILLMHHKKLDKWLQFGGHADGSADILDVAIRETQEESGIQDVKPLYDIIFDVDVHTIPANATKGEPEHSHYDIRYLLITDQEEFATNTESKELKWIEIDKAEGLIASESNKRAIEKLKKLL